MISGGQTGVDRAALDAAMAAGLPVGGWCPRGRRAEDGRIAERYPLRETPSAAYAQRTSWNVRDGDGTLILATAAPHGGTALTMREAKRHGKPLLHVALPDDDAHRRATTWLRENDIHTLNVAGPRESEAPGIYEHARQLLDGLFQSVTVEG